MDKNLFGEPLDEFDELVKQMRKQDAQERKWKNGFQKWSDEKAQDGLTHYGACGYGAICDFCDDSAKGRPCVRALNQMIREKRKSIDYETTSFEDAFDGRMRQRGGQ